MKSLLVILLELITKVLNEQDLLLMPLVLAIVGAIAIRAFLQLAKFSQRDVSLESRAWLRAGVKCALAYCILASGLLPSLWNVMWNEIFLRFYEFPSPLLQMLAMMAPMVFIGLVLVLVYLLLPLMTWLFWLLYLPPNLIRRIVRSRRASNSNRASEPEESGEDMDESSSQPGVWKGKSAWRGGTLGAFVLCLVLWALHARGPLPFFFLAAAMATQPVGPSLYLETSHRLFRRWILAAMWLYYWGTACIGWQYGWAGLLLLTIPALLISVGWLFIVSGCLLPFPPLDLYRGKRIPHQPGTVCTWEEQQQDFKDLLLRPENKAARREWFERRRMALRCLLTFTLGTNYPYYAVIDEKITERTDETSTWLTGEERLVERAEGDRFGDFMCGPGIVLTGCDHAVVLHSGIKLKGAKGPGIVFTEYGDRPTQAIDLRGQLCAFPVEAWTRDGIAVRVTTFIPFQIGAPKDAAPTLGRGFSYRPADVVRAIQAQAVEHKDVSHTAESTEKLAWYDLPRVVGERAMRKIIARCRFDQIYTASGNGAAPGAVNVRAQIAEELRKELDRGLQPMGIQRLGGGIGDIVPVDKERVIGQHIESWRSNWARRVIRSLALGQSSRLRQVEEARAQAQVEIILAIGKRIERLRDAGIDAIAREVIHFVEGLAQTAASRQRLIIGKEGEEEEEE